MKVKRQYEKRSIVFSYPHTAAFVTTPLPYPQITNEQLLEIVTQFYADVYGNAAKVTPIEFYSSFMVKTPSATLRLTWSWMPTYLVEPQKEKEIWKDVQDFEGLYQVSNLGGIRSMKFGEPRPMKIGFATRFKYAVIGLCKDSGGRKSKYVHRLVAEAFIDNPLSKKEVNHIDGDKKNNRVENLEWSTRSENLLHAFKNGLKKPVGAKLTTDQVKSIVKLHKAGISNNALSEKFNIGRNAISNIISGKSWSNVTGIKFI